MGIKVLQQRNNKLIEPRDIWLEKLLEGGLKEEGTVPRGGYFQVGVLGSSCDRLLYLHFNGLLKPEIIEARIKRILDNGTITQDRFEKYFKKLGIYKDKEIALTFDNPPLHGRLDFIIDKNGDDYIIELKTANTRNFSLLKDTAKKEHEVQLQTYLNIFNISEGGVLYENTDTKEIKAFLYRKDKEKWAKIVEKCNYIMSLKSLPDIKNVTHDKWCVCTKYSNDREEDNLDGIF